MAERATPLSVAVLIAALAGFVLRGIECGANIRDLLKDVNKKAGRKPTVRILATSCLDLCDHGPNMLVEPEHETHAVG